MYYIKIIKGKSNENRGYLREMFVLFDQHLQTSVWTEVTGARCIGASLLHTVIFVFPFLFFSFFSFLFFFLNTFSFYFRIYYFRNFNIPIAI